MGADPTLVAQLSRWLADTDITLLELRGPAGTLRLVREKDGLREEALAPDAAASEATETVLAPFLGVFLVRHPLRLREAASLGHRLNKGDVIGFLRVGPTLVAVRSPCDGFMQDVLATDGATVGFGTPLFAILPLLPGVSP